MVRNEKGQAFEPFNPKDLSGGGGLLSLGLDWPCFRLGDRGQAFEPFKMLIAAVMALAVLLIIIGAIQYFDTKQFDISKQRFYDGISNAVKQPNSELLVVESLQFQAQEAFSSNGIGKNVGIQGECIGFSGSGLNGIQTSPEAVIFRERIQVDSYIKCTAQAAGLCAPSCEICCDISFEEPS